MPLLVPQFFFPIISKITMVYETSVLGITCAFSVVWQCTKVQILAGANNLPNICFVHTVLVSTWRLQILQAFNVLILST